MLARLGALSEVSERERGRHGNLDARGDPWRRLRVSCVPDAH